MSGRRLVLIGFDAAALPLLREGIDDGSLPGLAALARSGQTVLLGSDSPLAGDVWPIRATGARIEDSLALINVPLSPVNPFSPAGINSTPPPTHPSFCLEVKTLPHQTAWSTTNIKNACDGSVTFDYDDCDQDANLQPACSNKTATLTGHNSMQIYNYRKEPMPRSFR